MTNFNPMLECRELMHGWYAPCPIECYL